MPLLTVVYNQVNLGPPLVGYKDILLSTEWGLSKTWGQGQPIILAACPCPLTPQLLFKFTSFMSKEVWRQTWLFDLF